MIAIYAHQSIEKPDAISIEDQINLCLRECTGEYTSFVEKNSSGKKDDTPAFNQLIKAVERGEIERIIVYRLDNIPARQ